jgi:small subunit ribosomal protein S6
MVHRYEALLLTVPEITQDETKSIENDVARIVQSGKGTIISFERWGKFKLAFPVKKNDYGVYFLVRFEIPVSAAVMEDIRSYFAVKLHEVVMRHMFTLLDPRKPLTYQRPKSLEEAPTHDVDTFLKENKMGAMVGSGEEDEVLKDLSSDDDSEAF